MKTIIWKLYGQLINVMSSLIRIGTCCLSCVIVTSCNNPIPDEEITLTSKKYVLNEFGQITSTNFSAEDFEPPKNCKECHPNHYQEWSESMHAYAMEDPIFFSGWEQAQHDYPETGERFCVQCHSPVAFLTGEDLSDYSTSEELLESDLPEQIKAGISCDICHSITSLSQTVHTDNNLAAVADYHLYPGEGIKIGSIQNPESNEHHESEYNPIFTRSELCLPCHDMTIRGVEAEITFTEWSRIPGLAMSGELSCQDCHMKQKNDGTHDHHFTGVDINLSYPMEESPLYNKIEELLQSAVYIKFGYYNFALPDSISKGETLTIPVAVSSLTAHAIPSGTSFSREAWLELVIRNDQGNILYQSGVIEDNSEPLDLSDVDLLLFTTQLMGENEESVNSIINAYSIINNSLPAFSDRYHQYNYDVVNDYNFLIVKVRMRFRSFKPYILNGHPDLLSNLPVFEMESICDTIYFKQ